MSLACRNLTEMKICKELKEKTGVEYAPCRGIMISEEDENTLYPNFDYFLDLAFSGTGLWSYYREGKVPCTWGTEDIIYDETHESNPKQLIPTWHEVNSIYHNFDTKLCGKILCKDTRVCTTNPPYICVIFETTHEDLIEKKKLPVGWHRKKNEEKNKWYYWEEGSNQSQWNHPCPTLMNILDRNIDNFKYVSDNFTTSIHGNMDLKDKSFVEILGLKMITKE